MSTNNAITQLQNNIELNANNEELINFPDKIVEDDFDYARKNIVNAIDKMTYALSIMSLSADQSRNSRDYRVLHELMSAYVKANQDLLSIHKQKIELEEKKHSTKSSPEKVINNNLFVGSTKELGEMLKKIKKETNE